MVLPPRRQPLDSERLSCKSKALRDKWRTGLVPLDEEENAHGRFGGTVLRLAKQSHRFTRRVDCAKVDRDTRDSTCRYWTARVGLLYYWYIGLRIAILVRVIRLRATYGSRTIMSHTKQGSHTESCSPSNLNRHKGSPL